MKQELVELYELGDEAWVVIAPELYRIIWINWVSILKKKPNNQLRAIPIIMRKNEIDNYNKPISFNGKQFVELYINNCSG